MVVRLGGSLIPLPTDDGRCLWIADKIETDSGTISNVAFAADLSAPFGTWPADAPFFNGVARSIVAVSGPADPTLVVQITGAYRRNGTTRVPYRLFRSDPGAVFGLTELGTGIGRWDGQTGQIIVGAAASVRFPTDVDLADDSLVLGDYAYLWGCPIVTNLSRQCLLGRLDVADTLQLYLGSGTWSAAAGPGKAVAVLTGGPWIASVLKDPLGTGLLHVFAPEFGGTLQWQGGPMPEGPWSGPVPLGPCSLPALDSKAFCAGPVVHTELGDPMRPSELVTSYDVETMAPSPLGDAGAYWTRLAWTTRP